MTDKQIHLNRVLIVSLPGMMQNMLKETFARRADVEVVGIASGGLSAVDQIRNQPPDLVVINSNLPRDEVNELVRWLKKEAKQIRSLVLVETTRQLSTAAMAGADITLCTYTLPDKLDMVLGNLNTHHKVSNE